jgi:streptogramin lyase
MDDLWRFDMANDTWERLAPRGRRPSARFGHSAVWAEGHGLVVFAGQRGTDFFGDLWTYDPADDRWTKLPARGAAPRPRYGSCMVVGSDGRLWISHGFTFLGRFDDTRVYDLERRRWSLAVRGDRRPGERCLHECFTSADGALALYGGQDDDDRALGDLWITRGPGSWRRLPAPSAPPRRLHAVTVAGDSAWVFGGVGRDDRRLDDLWQVDRETLGFERVRVTGMAPSARSASTLIFDAVRGRLLLFGGQGLSARSDLWQLTR